MRRKAPLSNPASPQTPQPASAPNGEPDESSGLSAIRSELDKCQGNGDIVVSIPIWGWTGDGKTCALLTAIHYSDPAVHLLELALVSDTDDLSILETSVEQYRGLNLAAAASSTTERLRELLKVFIDQSQWPPGTDETSVYVLEARNMASRLGYVVFPDIRGGSFREVDDTAKEILSRAHAAVLLVNADKYCDVDTDGKRYRAEILTRLQRFAKGSIPVCIMITKADTPSEKDSNIDKTHNQLTVAIDRQKALDARVFRVSISGTDKQCSAEKPPPAAEREPNQLVAAWMWAVGKALVRPVEEVRALLPSVNLQGTRRATQVALESLPELRLFGEFSNAPGVALCSTEDASIAFLDDSGHLLEAAFDAGRREPKVSQIGSLTPGDAALQGFYFKGEFVVGPTNECNSVWSGTRGGPLVEAALPSSLTSWVATGPRRIVGIDASGRLHACGFSAGKWTQLDYLEGVAEASDFVVCGYASPSTQIVIYTGDTIEIVQLTGDGRFREKVAPALTCKFNAPGAVTNNLGLCFARTTAGNGIVSVSGKGGDLGALHAETPLALAPNTALAAALDAQLRLTGFAFADSKVLRTAPAQSPILPDVPTGLLWSSKADILVATFDDSTWAGFRPLALE